MLLGCHVPLLGIQGWHDLLSPFNRPYFLHRRRIPYAATPSHVQQVSSASDISLKKIDPRWVYEEISKFPW
jgi:hypothetical protein